MKRSLSQSSLTVRLFGSLLVLLVCSLAVFAQLGSRAGRVDYSFNLGLLNFPRVTAMAVQPDGKVLIAGNFQTSGATPRYDLVRLNPDNSIDSGFNVTLGPESGAIYTMELQSDGRILIGGYFGTVNGVEKTQMARLNVDGSVDTSFTHGLGAFDGDTIKILAIQPDLKTIVIRKTPGEGNNQVTSRLNANGSNDPTFNVNLGPWAAAVDSSNRIVFCHRLIFTPSVFRVNQDGTRDNSFAVDLGGQPCRGVKALSDGRLLVWGTFFGVNGVARQGLAVLNSDGTLDQSFVPATGAGCITNVEVQPNGKIIFVGNNCGDARIVVGRLNADGSLDRSWHIGKTGRYSDFFNPLILTIKIRDARRLIVGGRDLRFDGVARSGVIQLKL